MYSTDDILLEVCWKLNTFILYLHTLLSLILSETYNFLLLHQLCFIVLYHSSCYWVYSLKRASNLNRCDLLQSYPITAQLIPNFSSLWRELRVQSIFYESTVCGAVRSNMSLRSSSTVDNRQVLESSDNMCCLTYNGISIEKSRWWYIVFDYKSTS